ncbi:MAG: DUF3873 domain-containing protein [Oscillospiraceae bacterium]|jgi:hypothetical protein|nr:DUF3873 domain-containing protein [Oscillospiraceae bacterium]
MLDPKNLKPGEEQYEEFENGPSCRRKTYVQYDYRDMHGELFSCVKPTLGICRAAKETWLSARMLKGEKV